jgi:chemotaxis protein methyltransferase CheR
MTLLENLSVAQGWDVRILATDLDTNVLATARRGIYSSERLKNIDSRRQRRWFRRGRGDNVGLFQVKPELQQMITFKQLNLMHDWPMKGAFDAIFCRNVIIYFDKPTQTVLMGRFADVTADHGKLFLGHSETLYRVTDRFRLMGQTIYEKSE